MRTKLPRVLVNKYEGVSEFGIIKAYDGIYINFYNIKQDHDFRRKVFPVIYINTENGLSIHVGPYYSRILHLDTHQVDQYPHNNCLIIDGIDIVESSP